MLNHKSLDILAATQWEAPFVRPLYKDYAFSCIPQTIMKLLTGEGTSTLSQESVGGSFSLYDGVIVLLIDGFGWEFFEQYRTSYPFLNKLYEEGVLSKISSQFPSTTAAHITTLHTGQEVGSTGIYEWFYYEPLVDAMIAPLLFSHAGDREANTLQKEGVSPHLIFPFETLAEKLKARGVRSLAFQQAGIAHSCYSQALLQGSERLSFTSFAHTLDAISAHLQQPLSQPTYCYAYFGEIDAAGHRHGLHSPQFVQAIDTCWKTIEEHLRISYTPNKLALLITADHGMTPVSPKETLLLNRLLPELPAHIKTNKQGLPLVPAGSCRDFFLHIKDDALLFCQKSLQHKLQGIAKVHLVSDLIAQGFFGSLPPSPRFLERVGNLVVLPYPGQSVFWHFEKHRLEQHFHAAHGGLTPEEMHSIFLFLEP